MHHLAMGVAAHLGLHQVGLGQDQVTRTSHDKAMGSPDLVMGNHNKLLTVILRVGLVAGIIFLLVGGCSGSYYGDGLMAYRGASELSLIQFWVMCSCPLTGQFGTS